MAVDVKNTVNDKSLMRLRFGEFAKLMLNRHQTLAIFQKINFLIPVMTHYLTNFHPPN